MKKLYAVILAVIVLLCCLAVYTGSSIRTAEKEKKETYFEDGYNKGYNDGYDAGYDEGSFYGYEDGRNEIEWAEEEAIFYAKENGGWHPEEAWMIIEAYRNKEPFYSDGSIPSEQDYNDAVNSLIYFFEYFYSKNYD